MARSGKKVMPFLSEGRFLANVVDGKIPLYGGLAGRRRWLLDPIRHQLVKNERLAVTQAAHSGTRVALVTRWTTSRVWATSKGQFQKFRL